MIQPNDYTRDLGGSRGTQVAELAQKTLIIDLMRRFSSQLGFVPGAAIDWYIESGNTCIATENAEAVGYVLGRPSLRYDRRIKPITQTAVRMDAQRREAGLRLVARVIADAADRGQECVQAWCADDIDARMFWKAAGFVAVCRRDPGNTRGRTLTLWRRPTRVVEWQPWMTTPPPRAGYRAANVGRTVQLCDALGRELDVSR